MLALVGQGEPKAVLRGSVAPTPFKSSFGSLGRHSISLQRSVASADTVATSSCEVPIHIGITHPFRCPFPSISSKISRGMRRSNRSNSERSMHPRAQWEQVGESLTASSRHWRRPRSGLRNCRRRLSSEAVGRTKVHSDVARSFQQLHRSWLIVGDAPTALVRVILARCYQHPSEQ